MKRPLNDIPVPDVADLVGDPWELYANGPNAWDCVTLVAEVYRRADLPFPLPGAYGAGEITAAEYARWAALFERVTPGPFAVLELASAGRDGHLAVMTDGGWAVHCVEGQGVVRQRYHRLAADVAGVWAPQAAIQAALARVGAVCP